jgi:hypothetical protein
LLRSGGNFAIVFGNHVRAAFENASTLENRFEYSVGLPAFAVNANAAVLGGVPPMQAIMTHIRPLLRRASVLRPSRLPPQAGA